MDVISFDQWEDIRKYLNGYSLQSAHMDSSGNLVASTSQGTLILARPVGNFWEPMDGQAYNAMDLILSEVKDQIRDSGDYSRSNKERILLNMINQKVIPLFNKYKN